MRLAISIVLGALAACSPAPAEQARKTAPQAPRPPVFTVQPGAFKRPMALAFLPDGRILVGQADGRMLVRKPDGSVLPVAGMPASAMLRDIAVMPGARGGSIVYFAYSEPRKAGGWLAVGRATIAAGGGALDTVQTLWRGQAERLDGSLAGAVAVSPDQRTLYFSAARERWGLAGPNADKRPPRVRGKKRPILSLATIFRIALPAPAASGLLPLRGLRTTPVSAGHRNPLGLGIAADGRLWESDMGPKGGDELNLILPGRDYGWPHASNGDNYDGSVIPDHRAGDGYEPPKLFWNPSVSPAGFLIYTGALFPEWRGSAFMGALSGEALVRVAIRGATAAKADQWPMHARIRDVAQAPDGAIWLIEDEARGSLGRLIRVTPAGR
ncbi:MAG: PQQ-dependent sugar dehydrogenase [Pseudomonadota bacterium]